MHALTWPTFVLQRRINEPLAAVERVVCDPRLLHGGAVFALDGGHGLLELERPFGVSFPPFGVAGTSWCASARARTRRGRVVERFELELNPWDPASAELLVRPRSTRPDRWTSHHLHRYFAVAHATADLLTRVLGAHARRAAAAPESDRPEPGRPPQPGLPARTLVSVDPFGGRS